MAARDNFSASPFFNYNSSGRVRQVWFDNVESLRMKYAMANDLGILGVGPFEFASVDPTSAEAREMWRAFDVFLKSDDTPQRRPSSSTTRTPPPAVDTNCPAGPWVHTGQIEATSPWCGLASDGLTDNSAALVTCLHLAANCSKTIFFPCAPPTQSQ